jgi:hypothetical protein
LNRDKKWCVLAFLAGMAGFAYAGLVLQNERISILFFGLCAFCCVTGLTAIKCARCKTAWGALVMNSGSTFAVSDKVVACPFCRGELDLPPDDPAQPEMERV